MVVEVNVKLKNGVLDPQAKAISQALKSLGFLDIKDVNLSKSIAINFDHDDKQKALQECEKMAQELLANTVIEEYQILYKG